MAIPATMKAVGVQKPGPAESLEDMEVPVVKPGPRDILVRIEAVSINPVDTKQRGGLMYKEGVGIFGYDGAGVVVELGAEAKNFKVGDEVYYAGSIMRAGTNCQYHCVDERIVAKKPKSLSFAEAAALPLTALTAYEGMFDRLDVKNPPAGNKLMLIIGGAGGVGSICTQLARELTDLTIVSTASREETVQFAKDCGAHHVIDHRKPLAAEIKKLGLGAPGFVFCTTNTESHWTEICRLVAPQGRLVVIDDPKTMEVEQLFFKSCRLTFELMFTRPIRTTADIDEQGKILAHVAELVDEKKIKTTLTGVKGTINAENLKKAHLENETGRSSGKTVLAGW